MCDRCVAGRWFISYHITISTNCIGPKDCMKYVLNKAAAGETLCRVFHFVAFPTLMHRKWSVYLVSINSWLTDAWCPVSLSLHSVHYSGGFQLCNPSLAGSEYLSSSLSTSLQEAVRHTQPGPCLSKPQSWIQSLQQNITTKDELECQSFRIVVWQEHRCFYQLMKYLQNQTIPVSCQPGGSYFIQPGTVQYSGPHPPISAVF